MSTLATCPDWCTWGHTLDLGENSHDGPSWATVGAAATTTKHPYP
jgi:hypothetical protein